MTLLLQQAEDQLKRFGLSQFRPGQDEVIAAVLAGRDCLCVMPTGGGKSLCYQLPAVMRDGLTVVVSPLIALMKDQVDSLHERGLSATCINSSLSPSEQHERIRRMQAGEYDLVYIAPERLRQSAFTAAVLQANVSLLAIDEAHCISEWGHDFRPDYARLGDFRERIGNPQTIALTATATPTVRTDVLRQLRLESADTFVTGFARPNLHFEVELPATQQEKDSAILRLLREVDGPAIIYAATRKRCEEVSELIQSDLQIAAGVYHGGLEPEQRREMQETFMSGDLDVIVATNAFGMGVDKSNLRLVAHYNMPGSLEAYYQEAGRAGRDGDDSRCVLLFSYADRMIQEYFIENNYPDRTIVSQVYEFLRSQVVDPIQLTQQEIREQINAKAGAEGVGAAIRILDRHAGAVRRLDANEKQASFWLNTEETNLVECLPREATVQRRVLKTIERLVGDRRFEMTPIRLEYLQQEAKLEREQLTRALRELMALPQFDYVAPFRGRALHVVDRSRPFSELEIDFNELARRRDAELNKLDQVVAYAYGRGCRQEFILNYFGDPHGGTCGHCDRCRNSGRGQVGSDRVICPDSDKRSEIVRKILSGVARGKGRFGKNVIAQMLGGSKSSKLSKFGLDRLTTFGLLDRFKQKEITLLIDELISAGLILQNDVDRFRPVVQLSTSGAAVMRGEQAFDRPIWVTAEMLPRLGGGAARVAGEKGADADPRVRTELKQWRDQVAQQRAMPAYTVLHNATIDRIAAAAPRTLEQLGHVKGVGPQCLAAWGEQILAVVEGQAVKGQAVEGEAAEGNAVESLARPESLELFEAQEAASGAESREVGDRETESAESGAAETGTAETVDGMEESPNRSATEAASEPATELAKAGGDPTDDTDDPEVWSFEALETAVDTGAGGASEVENQLSPPTGGKPSSDERPSAYWTWRLIEAGFSVAECERIRGLSAEQIAADLQEAERSDWSPEP